MPWQVVENVTCSEKIDHPTISLGWFHIKSIKISITPTQIGVIFSPCVITTLGCGKTFKKNFLVRLRLLSSSKYFKFSVLAEI